MEKKNIGAILIVLTVAFIFIYFFVFPVVGNPFVANLKVHATANILCWSPLLIPGCYFDDTNVILTYSPTGTTYKILPMDWYCGWLHGTPPDVTATLVVINPDSTQWSSKQVINGGCSAKTLDFLWVVPLAHGIGNYDLKLSMCGVTQWQFGDTPTCVEKEETYYYSG